MNKLKYLIIVMLTISLSSCDGLIKLSQRLNNEYRTTDLIITEKKKKKNSRQYEYTLDDLSDVGPVLITVKNLGDVGDTLLIVNKKVYDKLIKKKTVKSIYDDF